MVYTASRNAADPARPPTGISMPETEMKSQSVQLIISFSFFMARARTVLEAGLALKTHGSLVNGLTPLRAGRAGFFLSFKFKQPPILKAPVAVMAPPAFMAFIAFIAGAIMQLEAVAKW